jgi:hypothetical protein
LGLKWQLHFHRTCMNPNSLLSPICFPLIFSLIGWMKDPILVSCWSSSAMKYRFQSYVNINLSSVKHM